MLTEALEHAIIAGDQDAVIRLISEATESDRRKAAKHAVTLRRRIEKAFWDHYGDYLAEKDI